MIKLLVASAAAVSFAGAALAAPAIDGSYDLDYGTAKSVVTFGPESASYDFGNPTAFSEATGYSIYLTSDANAVYGYLKADAAGAGLFANLYFDLDPANANGSDLGFEVTNDRAFVPGFGAYSAPLAGLDFATSLDGTAIEFSIANALFTGPIAGLKLYPGHAFASMGSDVTLRLSQSFNYTVGGGASYGADRLGRVTLGGQTTTVPEPATWAMLIAGFGLVGGSFRSRRSPAVVSA